MEKFDFNATWSCNLGGSCPTSLSPQQDTILLFWLILEKIADFIQNVGGKNPLRFTPPSPPLNYLLENERFSVLQIVEIYWNLFLYFTATNPRIRNASR